MPSNQTDELVSQNQATYLTGQWQKQQWVTSAGAGFDECGTQAPGHHW